MFYSCEANRPKKTPNLIRQNKKRSALTNSKITASLHTFFFSE